MSAPLIAIVLDEAEGDAAGFSRRDHYALRKDYFSAVAQAGGVPVGVGYDMAAARALLERVDGWLIPGGDYRFEPDWYAAPPPVERARPGPRGAFERAFVADILARDAPLLGVCNGMQVLSGALGAKMAFRPYDAQGEIVHASGAEHYAEHPIRVEAGSLLHRILGRDSLIVNSAHRERVVDPGRALVSARAEDGVIEAVEAPGRRFALGVQWHPELDGAHTGGPLLRALVVAAAAGQAP